MPAGSPTSAVFPDFRVNLLARNFLAPPQLIQTDFNFRIKAPSQGLAVFAEVEPFHQRLRLRFIQALHSFNRQFHATHAENLATRTSARNAGLKNE